MSLFSAAFDRALRLAAVVHARQRRKGTEVPYIAHPLHVARLLALDGQPEPVVVAGVLHDVLEDFDGHDTETRARLAAVFPALKATPAEASAWAHAVAAFVADEFGAETKRLVDAVTEAKRDGDRPRAWKLRKLEQLQHLREADARVAALKAADALHNVSSILIDVAATGPEVFSRFKASIDQTLWHYGTVAAVAAERLCETNSGLPLELEAAVDRLTEAVESLAGPRDPCTGRWTAVDDARSQLVIVGADGARRVHGVEQWRVRGRLARGDAHWKPGRSGLELARAWVGGLEPTVPPEVQALLDRHSATRGTTFATARAGRVVPGEADDHGWPCDVMACGVAEARRVVAIVEAKGDEPFGPRVAETLEVASRVASGDRAAGRAGGGAARVDALARLVFGRPVDAALGPLRVQLLQGVAGAVLEARRAGADLAVYVVHEFVGPVADAVRVEANRADLDALLAALAESTPKTLVPGELAGPFHLRSSDPALRAVMLYVGRVAATIGVRS